MATHDSWLDIPKGSHFSRANIPFGIISTSSSIEKHAAIAIGDHVLDLHEFSRHQGFMELQDFPATHIATFSKPSLNDFAALGQDVHTKVRRFLQDVFAKETSFPGVLRDNIETQRASLFRRDQVTLHLPMKIGGYTDFFAGKNHAYNCGCIFRDPTKALQPNYFHLPVAYNSRASSVVLSGTGIHRPLGQFLENPSAAESSFGPCRRLDIELELGALLCKGNQLGEPIDVNEAEKHIFGLVLLNDWSARDIQAWEAVPLGPFNAKTFATTISPWVVLKDALDMFRTPGILNETKLHPYLQEARKENVYDMNLEVELTTTDGESVTLSRTNGRNLVYSFAQMIAHHTIGGCPLEVGDLIGSGTISGAEPGTLGSLLEASHGGKRSYDVSPTIKRTFLEDGDRVTIRGWCGGDYSELVGFGECSGTILPAPKPSWLET
ncbi:fumarylacetoacetase [Cladophialophora bantiana CBS 173.52]|uniref:Fumarylacetoacetase n=1 Tax=Cladophialophora bantiana (strain ATCC 10958 / CBS 173.52 / CDC B-1940 / NIH 8579) TaxID=1442370 RepID=A0A0D2F5C4_CLAB1|nr:fumarylacetoacetase [Cladophialophora bantiana CBS 173.52]KIW97421.1 fumarylacetoacetase [Cladophialophora bantiana CBS 173.52]